MNQFEKFDPGRRQEIAKEVRGKRQERDESNEEAGTFKAKIKDFFGMSGGSAELEEKSEKLSGEAWRELEKGKKSLKEGEERRYYDVLHHVDVLVGEVRDILGTGEYKDSTQEAFDVVEGERDILEGSLFDDNRRNLTLSVLNRFSRMLFFNREEAGEGGTPKNEVYSQSRSFFLDFFKNTEVVEAAVQSESDDDYKEGVEAIENVIDLGGEKEKSEMMRFLERHLDIPTERLLVSGGAYLRMETGGAHESRSFFRMAYTYGSDELKDKVVEKLRNLASSENDLAFALAISVASRFYRPWEKEPEAHKGMQLFLESIAARYNLPFKDSIEMWRWVEGSNKITENFDIVRKIEEERPGIAKFLMDKFGIKCFDRYPEEILIRQYDEYSDLEKPYGVVIYPRSDWNGVFSEDGYKFKNLFEEIGDKYSIRVAEAENSVGVMKRLATFNALYGSKHKISFAILGGHGTPEYIQLKTTGRYGDIRLSDFEGAGVQRLKEFFESNPEIVLFSCSTGKEKGIAQKMSDVFGAEVIAPNIPSSPKSLGGKIESDGRIKLTVEFTEEGDKRAYSKGLPKDEQK